MTEKELDIVAEKVANIVWNKFEKQQQETAERQIAYLMNTPFPDFVTKHKKMMAGKTVREGLDELKKL